MTGTKCCSQDCRAVTGPLPGAPFRLPRIITRRFACWSFLTEADVLATAFRSLATTARFRATIARSKFLACCFVVTPARCLNRSASCSSSPDGYARQSRDHSYLPVSRSETDAPSRAPHLRSPSGFFVPSGSKRSIPFAAGKLTFRIRPLALRSPQPLYGLVAATDQRSRLATFPEARCSSNLLEPPPYCSQARSPSRLFCHGIVIFRRKNEPLESKA